MKEGYNGKYGSQSSSCSVPSSPWDLGSVRCHGKGMVFAWIGDPAAPTGPLLTQLAPSSLRFISLEYLQSSAQYSATPSCYCTVLVYVATSLLTNG